MIELTPEAERYLFGVTSDQVLNPDHRLPAIDPMVKELRDAMVAAGIATEQQGEDFILALRRIIANREGQAAARRREMEAFHRRHYPQRRNPLQRFVEWVGG